MVKIPTLRIDFNLVWRFTTVTTAAIDVHSCLTYAGNDPDWMVSLSPDKTEHEDSKSVPLDSGRDVVITRQCWVVILVPKLTWSLTLRISKSMSTTMTFLSYPVVVVVMRLLDLIIDDYMRTRLRRAPKIRWHKWRLEITPATTTVNIDDSSFHWNSVVTKRISK